MDWRLVWFINLIFSYLFEEELLLFNALFGVWYWFDDPVVSIDVLYLLYCEYETGLESACEVSFDWSFSIDTCWVLYV